MRKRLAAAVLAAAASLLAVPGHAAAARGPGEALARLFDLTERAAGDNADALAWLATEGERGLHPESHRGRAEAVRRELAGLGAPELAEVTALVDAALASQLAFLADWYAAVRAGSAFESQLTHEFGWHEELERSHRALLRAYTQLLAAYPDASPDERDLFRRRLCALDLRGRCR